MGAEGHPEELINVIAVPLDKTEAAIAALRAAMGDDAIPDQGAGTGCKKTSPAVGETDFYCADSRT